MKTKERGKVLVPILRKDACGPRSKAYGVQQESCCELLYSKMKVHPEISMKTNDR